jgi:hypothetical protein
MTDGTGGWKDGREEWKDGRMEGWKKERSSANFVHRVTCSLTQGAFSKLPCLSPDGARGEYFLFHNFPLLWGEGARRAAEGLSLIERPFGRARTTPR